MSRACSTSSLVCANHASRRPFFTALPPMAAAIVVLPLPAGDTMRRLFFPAATAARAALTVRVWWGRRVRTC